MYVVVLIIDHLIMLYACGQDSLITCSRDERIIIISLTDSPLDNKKPN